MDYSEVLVEKTKKVNKRDIDTARCQVVQGNISFLPFEDEFFDLATAFETVCFWPGPTESFQEVWRVLKSKGIFMIVNEIDGKNKDDDKWTEIIDGMKIFDKIQLSEFLKEAELSKIDIYHDENKHRLCILAKK